ncbi:MAG: hypothetical protein Q9173_005327 [Seirophora scorigena]
MQLGSRGPPLLRSQTPLLVLLTPSLSSHLSLPAAHTCRTYLAIANLATLNRQLSASNASRRASSAGAAAQQSSPDDNRSESRPQPQPLLRTPPPRSAEEMKSRQSSFLDKIRNPGRRQEASQTEDNIDSRIDSLLATSRGSKEGGVDPPAAKTETNIAWFDRVRAEQRTQDYRKDYLEQQDKDRRQGRLSRNMRFPLSMDSLIPQQSMEFGMAEATRATATIKSRPSLGRTVEVVPDRGMDLGKALKSLEISCSANQVRRDLYKQRYYERPGQKRKRLHSERWRRRFKIGFKAVVAKVKSMRRKGW